MKWFKHGFEAIQEILRFNVSKSKRESLLHSNWKLLPGNFISSDYPFLILIS